MRPDGTWKIEITTDEIDPEIVPRTATLTIESQGSELSGWMEGPYPMGEGVIIRDGTINGDSLFWRAAMRGEQLRPQVLEFSGTLTDNEMTGEVEVGIFGTATFKASHG